MLHNMNIFFLIDRKILPKEVLSETLLCTMKGIGIFQKPSYREISLMWGRPMQRPPVFHLKKKIFFEGAGGDVLFTNHRIMLFN